LPRLLAILAVLLPLAFVSTARAADPVTNTNDAGPGSLRNALATALGTPGADTIDLIPGTYNLTSGELVIGDTLTINGPSTGNAVIRATGPFRVFHVTANAAGAVEIAGVAITGGNVSGSGGGIFDQGAGELTVRDSTVSGNTASPGTLSNSGGGGIYNGAGVLTIRNSTIDGNVANVGGPNSGGGGILAAAATSASLNNTTISGNRATATGAPAAQGGGILNISANPVTLGNTILAGNVSTLGTNCAPGPGAFTSTGSNLESASTCNLTAAGDKPNTDPRLDPLADNGGGTPTRALQPSSPAIDGGDQGTTVCEPQDQRGVNRTSGGCDIGAYEFDGLAVATIPPCTRSGDISLTMTAAPSEGVEGLKFSIDGQPQPAVRLPGGSTGTATINVPEGRRQLEYQGDFTNGDELERHAQEAVVDRTDPNVAIRNDQRLSIFVITRRVTVSVDASDSISGLVTDPSGASQAIGTARRGGSTVEKTAMDLCGNTDTAAFPYTVLGPALGTRIVLEPIAGSVRLGGGGGARASQKGQRFQAVRVPREAPVGTLLDASRGTARVTTSQSRREGDIQDGAFTAGVFQVLQSRSRRARGVTELRLKGSSFNRCRSRRSRTRAGAAQLSPRTVRRLRANATGRFRTRGRHSAATVRGTIWLTADRCDGTLTKVRRGRVAVRDFRRKRTVIVRAGKSYLARAPR
jgi:hypothetical protein